VFAVTAENTTSESLKNAFANDRRDFVVQSLTGSSHKTMREFGTSKADVALISEDLHDGPQAGIKVLEKLRNSQLTDSIMLLHCSKPSCVIKAFRGGARGIFYRSHSLKALSKCPETVHNGQIWASNEDLEHLINALTHIEPLHFNNSEGTPY
jgi:two-component system nitrate/nitrite response regulator NarL